jgi:signal transduction histidine kinase
MLTAGLTGIAWNILGLLEFSFWLVVMTFLLIISAVSVLTYSFVSFTQSREVRHLMLLLMSANIMIWAFLFLLSHPSSINWSVLFSEKNRNRTLVIAFVLIVIPTILLGSFRGEVKTSRPSVLSMIIWGAVIMPITSLALFFSRDPLFILVTSDGGGIEGLTPTGVILSIGFMFSQILALPRIIQQWWKTRNTLDLSLMLAMSIWLMGALFGMIAWDPLQVAEILWMGSIIGGFFLIAVVQFVTSILHPHRNLEQLVSLRTKELNLSNQESEFYLKMWTHKIGNFLQGMITYLDILEMAEQFSEDDKKTRAAASDLSRDAAMVNQQVVQLSRIKESMNQVLWPVNLPQIVDDAVESAKELLGEESFSVKTAAQEKLVVEGDDLLPLAFQSTIAFHLKNRLHDQPEITFEVTQRESASCVRVSCRGRPMPDELKLFIESDGMSGMIALDLDLFTVKLLMNRYNVRIVCSREEESEENSCTFIFPTS